MKLSFPKNWFQPTKITCVEIAQVNGDFVYRVSVLEKSKATFERLDHQDQLHSFEELTAFCQQHSAPLCLTFSLAKTIYRKVKNSSANWKSQLNEIIPGLQAADYFIQQSPQLTDTWLSFIRKDLILPWLDKFKTADLQIYVLQLGPFPLREVRQAFDFSATMQSSSFSLSFDSDQTIKTIAKGNFDSAYSIEKETNEKISNDQVLLIACGVAALSNPNFGIAEELMQREKKEVLAKRKLTKLFTPLLFSIAGLAILGGIGNVVFNKKINTLRSQLASSNSQFTLLDSISTKIDNHQKLLNETAFVGNSRVSFFSDRIANSIPAAIKISDINLFPVLIDKKGYDEQEMKKFNTEEIKIQGSTKNSETYYNWLNELTKLDWIKTANHQSYQEEKIGIGKFELVITIN